MFNSRPFRFASVILLLALAAASAVAAVENPRRVNPASLVGPTLVVRSFPLNDFVHELDGQWQGMTIASDGKVYFASSSHSARHGAAFFRYDPAKGNVDQLCEDVTRLCGEDPTQAPPQGKIHSDIMEVDGWLYFATHLANYWREAVNAYTGGHIVGYNLATGEFRDLGIVHPNYTIYSGIAADKARKRLYVFVTPFRAEADLQPHDGSRLYRIDLTTGAKTDLGVLAPRRSASSHLFVDPAGDCYLTAAKSNNSLFRVAAGSDVIERLDDALPPRHDFSKPDVLAANQRERFIRWGSPSPDGRTWLFAIQDCGNLWRFTPTPSGTGDGPGRFEKAAFPGPTYLGMAMNSKRVFFVQRADGKPGVKADNLHLRSVSLTGPSGEVADHGRIVDQHDRIPWRIESMAADDHGRVFMTGDWRTLPGDKGTLRHERIDGENHYTQTRRGQFFSVVELQQ